MRKLLFTSIVIFNSSILLMAQNQIKLIKETKQLPDETFQIIEKNIKGDTLVNGVLSSIDPEIKNGVFYFYDSDRILEAKGYYAGDVPSNIWNYYDKQGNIVRTINYDKTIGFLNADTIVPKEVFLVVEQMPDFKFNESDTIHGNMLFKTGESFRQYVKENLVYPIYAAKKSISNRVFIQFVITETGKVCNLKVLRSSGNLDLNMEALRVISESPQWESGRQRNVPVAVSYTFPITFHPN